MILLGFSRIPTSDNSILMRMHFFKNYDIGTFSFLVCLNVSYGYILPRIALPYITSNRVFKAGRDVALLTPYLQHKYNGLPIRGSRIKTKPRTSTHENDRALTLFLELPSLNDIPIFLAR